MTQSPILFKKGLNPHSYIHHLIIPVEVSFGGQKWPSELRINCGLLLKCNIEDLRLAGSVSP